MKTRARLYRVIPFVAAAGLAMASWECGGGTGSENGDASPPEGSTADGPADTGHDGRGGHHEAGHDARHEAGDGGGPDASDGGGPDAHDGGGPDASDGGGPDARDGGGPDAHDGGGPDAHDGGGPDARDGGGPDVLEGGGPDVHESGPDVLDSGPDVILDSGPPLEAGSPPLVIASHETASTLAADDTYVYWVNSSAAVLDCPVAGCPGNIPTLLAFNGTTFGSAESLGVASTTAFFVDSSLNVDSCAGGGCGLAPDIYEGSADGGFSSYSALVTDASNVYFTDGSTLYQCPIGSTCASPTTLYSDFSTTISAIAVAGSNVYFVREGSFDVLFSVPVGGGTESLVCVSNDLSGVESIVATTNYVYFTSFDAPKTIIGCPASGGKPFKYFVDVAPYGLATDGTYLYWTNDTASGDVSACAVGAGCSVKGNLATGQAFPQFIAVNGTSVFWTTSNDIMAVTK